MNLTLVQLQALKADILADATLAALPRTADGFVSIAAAYNGVVSPDFWVWRTSVMESEYTRQVDSDGGNWSWSVYINRIQGERDAWARLFMGGGTGCNPSLLNVRAAFADIFSGIAQPAVDQRTHLAAVSRRKASRGEKLFATGTGTTVTPATLGPEGQVSAANIEGAFGS